MATDEKTMSELVALLNGEDTNEAEEARAELESYGQAILLPLLEAAPSFGRFGQLCAIELLQRLGDPRAGAVLITMLRSEHDTVRDWAASALGDLDVDEAVPELRRAYEEAKRQRTPLNWTEPESLRRTLTQLGARDEVVPPRVNTLSRNERALERCWPVEDLVEVIDALADANQLVLWFQLWERWGDTHRRRETPGWELDWLLPWRELVNAARRDALDAARKAGTPKNTVATVSWMNQDDL
jgi:HEAT repeat protein